MTNPQDHYDRMAAEENKKLEILEQKQKKKAMTEREKTSKATEGLIPKGNRVVINTLPFADIVVTRDSKNAEKRSDGLTQRFG